MRRTIHLALMLLVALAGLSIPGEAAAQSAERCFPETGFCISGPIRAYWEQNGGLERFGYPITREREETLGGRNLTVQYFERRRMEYHPEHSGTPHEVLLGLLGTQVFGVSGSCAPWFFRPAPQRCSLGAPTFSMERCNASSGA